MLLSTLTALPVLLLLTTSTNCQSHSNTHHRIYARQYAVPPLYGAQSGGGPAPESPPFGAAELQYDVGNGDGALSSPQLQYPGVGGGVGYPQVQGGYYPGGGAGPNLRTPSGQQPILIYSGAGGQPFLVNPSGLPPGTNFLYPQNPGQPALPPGGLDPGFIYRDAPPPPPSGFNPGQPPVFVAGYPKPGQIPAGGYRPPGGMRPAPPIEKDAEEIPTGPGATIPPHPQGTKPQKIETFDEPPVTNNKPSDKTDEPAAPQPTPLPKKPTRQRPKLNPGQRFFILNGQPLFLNYPYSPYFGNGLYQGIGGPAEFYKQQYQQPPVGSHFTPTLGAFTKPSDLNSYRNYLYKNGPILDDYPGPGYKPQNIFFKNIVPFGISNRVRNNPLHGSSAQHLTPVHSTDPAFSTSSSYSAEDKQNNLQSREYEQKQISKSEVSNYDNEDDGLLEEPHPSDRLDYFRYGANQAVRHVAPTSAKKIAAIYDDKDSVVIDAKIQQNHDSSDQEEDDESEDVEAAQPRKVIEPSISQAQPGAIALAGPGGVAAAGPRGTALAGAGGLAVSSPSATAIAGPRHDDSPAIDNKPAKKSKQ